MMAFMKGRVLVVDDDTALAEMLGIVLRGEGFEPSFVADGDKALAAFREAKPDLVLLDLMLPGRDGIEVCRLIRAESGAGPRRLPGSPRPGPVDHAGGPRKQM
ncbi:response regulator, partial [Streptomyces scabiei]|uniref:response regulator n=1 Tax=Streptomyces scabiei TaxID=1930 RepID=UPI0038F788AC